MNVPVEEESLDITAIAQRLGFIIPLLITTNMKQKVRLVNLEFHPAYLVVELNSQGLDMLQLSMGNRLASIFNLILQQGTHDTSLLVTHLLISGYYTKWLTLIICLMN